MQTADNLCNDITCPASCLGCMVGSSAWSKNWFPLEYSIPLIRKVCGGRLLSRELVVVSYRGLFPTENGTGSICTQVWTR